MREFNWRKSSFSTERDCVEVRSTGAGVEVRDTKDRDGGTLRFTADEWSAFVNGVRGNEFDI